MRRRFFSFKAKELGCRVTAIDAEQKAIDICNYIKSEQNLDIEFKQEFLDLEYVQKLKDKQYDVIFLLNVMHHVCHNKGWDYAKNILDALAQKCKLLITELAVKKENLYWNKNLPVDYNDWVSAFKFSNTIGWTDVQHLSQQNPKDLKRPLVLCSNEYVLCNGTAFKFDLKINRPFDLLQDNPGKNFFLGKELLIKHIIKKFVDEEYLCECEHSISILGKYKDISFFPKLITHENTDDCITIVTQIERAETLYDLIKKNKTLDKNKIILDILDNLIELEKKGLYHNDIRPWNIILNSKNKAVLIDVGAIDTRNNDCFDNKSTHKAYIVFILDFLTGTISSDLQHNITPCQHIFDHNENFSMLEPHPKLFFEKIKGIIDEEPTFEKIKQEFVASIEKEK